MIKMNNTNHNGDSYVTPLLVSAVGIIFTILVLLSLFFIFWWHYLRPHQSSHGTTNTNNTINGVKNSKGVPEEILDKIRIITYLSPPPETDVQIECSICLGQFKDEEKVRVLPNCNHAFHVPCIDAWFKEHTNCPICRSPVDCDCESASLPTDSSENIIQPRIYHVMPIDNNNQLMDDEFQRIPHPVMHRHSHSDSFCHRINKNKPHSLGMRLKRSLSMDQSSLYVAVTIQRDQEQEQAEASTSSSSPCSSASTIKWVLMMHRYKSKSLKNHMSRVLMRSFSRCGRFSGILPN